MFNFLIVLLAVTICIIAVAGIFVPVVWYKEMKMLMDKEVNEQLDELDRQREQQRA